MICARYRFASAIFLCFSNQVRLLQVSLLLSRPTRLTFSTLHVCIYSLDCSRLLAAGYGKKCTAYSDGHGIHAKQHTDVDSQTSYALLVRNFLWFIAECCWCKFVIDILLYTLCRYAMVFFVLRLFQISLAVLYVFTRIFTAKHGRSTSSCVHTLLRQTDSVPSLFTGGRGKSITT